MYLRRKMIVVIAMSTHRRTRPTEKRLPTSMKRTRINKTMRMIMPSMPDTMTKAKMSMPNTMKLMQ